jgi:hypothetical protein
MTFRPPRWTHMQMVRVLSPAFLVALATAGCLSVVGCSTPSEQVGDSSSEIGARAPDPTGMGPLATTSSEYRLPSSVDADILGDRQTEVWARIYRPATLTEGEKHPLLVFLHGNHGTCGRGTNPRVDDSTAYTSSGTCPSGYVVTPNHLGYGYVAERLASWGYVVVSINANRGITAGGGASGDSGLNLARGRLVLKHLQLLSQWNREPGTTPESLGFDLNGKLDFANIGMMGHSRGGEGVRAAYVQYHDQGSTWPAKIQTPVNVKAIFEIGPVDGQTSRTLDALGTAWNVILPMCDGDVSNLQGMKPFDRMLNARTENKATPKGMFAVWGANHNYYNTEWQTSDSRSCRGTGHLPLWENGQIGSEKQQTTGLHALMGFFRAHVGGSEGTFNNVYDPQYAIPESLEAVTRIERAYADAVHENNVVLLENFTTAVGTSLGGQPTTAQNVTVRHGTVSEHDAVLKAANVSWTAASDQTFYEIPFTGTGVGLDASAMKTFDFRVSLQNSTGSATEPTNFTVQLVNADNTVSQPRKIRDYVELYQPGGHVVLDSARIPLTEFAGADLTKVRGVRFTFNDTAAGAIHLASVRFSRSEAPRSTVSTGTYVGLDTPGGSHETVNVDSGNQRPVLRARPDAEIEVELTSATAFPVTDDLPRLRVGNRDIVMSRFADDGDTHKIIFRMTPQEFASLPNGAGMKVRYGDELANREWNFGKFDKAGLQ